MKASTATVAILFLLLPPAGSRKLTAQQAESGDITPPASELAALLQRYATDRSSLDRYYGRVRKGDDGRERMAAFSRAWKQELEALRFERLKVDSRVDFLLLENLLQYRLRRSEIEREQTAETAILLPFRPGILDFEQSRLVMKPAEPRAVAAELTRHAEVLDKLRKRLEKQIGRKAPDGKDTGGGGSGPAVENGDAPLEPVDLPKKPAINRASREAADLAKTLEEWFTYYDGYNPLFSWWVQQPYTTLHEALLDYSKFLKEELVGIKEGDEETIVGDPIGREALQADLDYEMIPYTPEEIVEIANQEFAWCEREMLKASRDLGFGNDWKAALEFVKQKHVEPGKQPALISELALEAVQFVEERDLVSVPPLAKSTWRMQMLSPKQQLVSPFFLGGEIIRVSYPTDTMTHEQKLMSMRGNNRHFSRATVQHELIPGHHLQGFMTSRFNTHRRVFSTPFWREGWALYWEMLLWDLDFPQTPEDRIGMLFWRSHRAARIIFSLSFHLETMTPEECINLLVDKVGHERANAAAEVRRSFNGSYAPLYQAAYMLGGLQFRALHRELVQSGQMSNREFHDAILRENAIPVEMVRALLTRQELSRNYRSSWRFYD